MFNNISTITLGVAFVLVVSSCATAEQNNISIIAEKLGLEQRLTNNPNNCHIIEMDGKTLKQSLPEAMDDPEEDCTKITCEIRCYVPKGHKDGPYPYAN